MIRGLRTVIYKVSDLQKARDWYTAILGKPPYFDQPFYVGFNVGGFELGLDPEIGNVTLDSGNVAYWGVDDARKTFETLIAEGAQAHGDVKDVGDGILVATVLDPCGNVFGIIENKHFKFES